MLNDHDLAALLLVTSGVLRVTTLGFAIAWVRARERVLRAHAVERQWLEVSLPNSGKLEQAVDAIAVEVERIAEGQRFVTKLLAERGDHRRSSVTRSDS